MGYVKAVEELAWLLSPGHISEKEGNLPKVRVFQSKLFYKLRAIAITLMTRYH